MVRSTLRSPVLLSLLAVAISTGGFADPPDLAKMTGKELWEYAEGLRTKADPGAKAAYQYLVDHHPEDQVYAPLALYRQCMLAYNLSSIAEALGCITTVLEKYPDSGACRSGYVAHYLSAIQLVYRPRNVSDEQYLEQMTAHLEKWSPNLNTWEWSNGIARTAAVCLRLGRPEAGLKLLEQHLPHCLRLLVDNVDFWPDQVDLHLALGQKQEALQAARQAFACCDYSERGIRQAADLVQRVYAACEGGQEPELPSPIPAPEGIDEKLPAASVGGLAFLSAQSDPAAANPLAGVAPPVVREECRQQLLAGAGTDANLVALVHLYCGQPAEALDCLQRALAEGPDAKTLPGLLKSVCRVVKGQDLNLRRANALVGYLAGGGAQQPPEVILPGVSPGAGTDLKPVTLAGGPMVEFQKWRLLINRRELKYEDFPQWAAEHHVSAETLAAALACTVPVHRPDPTYKPVAAALWQELKGDLEAAKALPAYAKVKLSCWLGTRGKVDEARTLMLSLTDEEATTISGSPFYVLADEAEHGDPAGNLLSIWAYKEGARRRGGGDPVWVASIMTSNYRSLGDPKLVRDDLLPYAEKALALPGAEDRFGSGLYALLWGYEFVGEPLKGVERVDYWLGQIAGRKLAPTQLYGAVRRVATVEAGAGKREAAVRRLQAFAETLPAGSQLRPMVEHDLQALQNPVPPQGAPPPGGAPPPPPPAPAAR